MADSVSREGRHVNSASGLRRVWRRTLALAPVLVALVVLSVHTVCDLQFDCGCEPLWAGAVEHCNIRQAGAPDCPWCTQEPLRLLGLGALILGTPLLALVWAADRGAGTTACAAAALGGYALGSLLAGGLAAWLYDYPRWLGLGL